MNRLVRFAILHLVAVVFLSAQALAITCPIDSTLPSDGDVALARKDYKQAEVAFRSELATNAQSETARLGLIRALIGENDVTQAHDQAATMLTEHPKDALAEVATAEAAYRAANFVDTQQHAHAAMSDDPCEGRAFAIMALLESTYSYYALSSQHLSTAHKLRPKDELIRRAWIRTLSRKLRKEELSHYLDGQNNLSADDRTGYLNSLNHLNASRPGECRITSKAETTRIPLTPLVEGTYLKSYGLEVAFDSKKRRMQIDTGASGITLTASAAKRLGIAPEYHAHTGGIGDQGEVQSFLTHVANIQIGDIQVSDCMVEVIQTSRLDVDGLIGLDVFSKWLVTLDYQKTELRLAPLPPRPKIATPGTVSDSDDDEGKPHDRYVAPEMQDWLKVIRIGHNLLIPASVNLKSTEPHYMIMDTGSSMTTLSVAFAKEGGKLSSSDITFKGISGNVKKAYSSSEIPLYFGSFRLPPATFPAFDITNISHDVGFEVSGLVGLPTLSRLSMEIDYRDNLVHLTYDPKKDQQRFRYQ